MGAPACASSSSGTIRRFGRKGSSIDVRANGGGNVSRMLIERLRRELLGVELRADRRIPEHVSRSGVRRPQGLTVSSTRYSIVGRRQSSRSIVSQGKSRVRSLASDRGAVSWVSAAAIPLIDGGKYMWFSGSALRQSSTASGLSEGTGSTLTIEV
jgi:hypothetical protein